MKFVIVENNIKTQKMIKDIVLKTAFNIDNFKIEKYATLDKELIKTIEDQSIPKVYLLDIELNNNVSGIQIAKKIRENDWESHIIFLTSHDKMFEYVHRTIYEVFDFIEKFHNMEERLTKSLKIILNKKYDNKLFKYENSRIELQLYLHEITYIYRDTNERKLVIHTSNNKFKVALTLNEILTMLDSRFKQVHRACIVNTDRVKQYDWRNREFNLDTNETIPLLSKKYRNEVVMA